MTTPKPALPEPDGYFYEVDGYFGIHRQFDTAPYNGMRPHRTVGYFTADTTRAAIDAAVAEARAVPEGMVLAPHFRGYAHLGTGQYLLNHSAADEPAELVISIATDEQKAGREVGDDRGNPADAPIQPEVMAVRLRFENVAGLDALEKQLRYLRAEHFAATPSPAEQPKPAVLDRAAPASEGSGGDATEASLSDTKPLDDPRLQQLFGDAIEGALAFGYQGENAAPPGHWLERFWRLGRAEAEKTLAATPPPMPARLNDQRIVELMRPLADDALIRPHVIAAARAVIAEYERINGITPAQG